MKSLIFMIQAQLKFIYLDQKLRYELIILDNLDAMTKVHCENVGNLTGRICQKLRLNKKFTVYAMICGYLHDIGKAYIPKEILTKDGPLTEEEFEIMKTHTTIGYNVCMRELKITSICRWSFISSRSIKWFWLPKWINSEGYSFCCKNHTCCRRI